MRHLAAVVDRRQEVQQVRDELVSHGKTKLDGVVRGGHENGRFRLGGPVRTGPNARRRAGRVAAPSGMASLRRLRYHGGLAEVARMTSRQSPPLRRRVDRPLPVLLVGVVLGSACGPSDRDDDDDNDGTESADDYVPCTERFPESFPEADPARGGYVAVPGTAWRIWVDPALVVNDAGVLAYGGTVALSDTIGQLEALRVLLPDHAAAILDETSFILEARGAVGSAATYFGIPLQVELFESREGFSNDAWTGSVVLFGFGQGIEIADLLIAHEFAHAYHDRFLCMGPAISDEAALPQAAYDNAVADGAYTAPGRVDCESGVPYDAAAYAITNELEYFAELSSTFFAGGTSSPCDRAELIAIDPEGAEMVQRTWFVGDDWPDESASWDPVPWEPQDSDGTCDVVGQDSVVEVSCPAGSLVSGIGGAIYGRPAGTCAGYDAEHVDTFCDASQDVTAVVEGLCVGLERCTVEGTGALFGDPCPGMPKKLLVDWTCE